MQDLLDLGLFQRRCVVCLRGGVRFFGGVFKVSMAVSHGEDVSQKPGELCCMLVSWSLRDLSVDSSWSTASA